ncbi:hypothetical protein [Nannocystis pusilla]|uniref:hypothetical protein n=1 Tax=Nannocystis pusilla TaxID=889268 RepID=UPI003B78992D
MRAEPCSMASIESAPSQPRHQNFPVLPQLMARRTPFSAMMTMGLSDFEKKIDHLVVETPHGFSLW